MAFKTFVALDPLPASDLNTYLMKQAVIVCTSGTRPSSPVTGMLIFETDTKRFLVYGSSAWCTISPVHAWVATAQSTTSPSYTDLATAGPAVSSVQTGASALVAHGANMYQTTGGIGYMSLAVSGATTTAASDTWAVAESSTASAISGAIQYPHALTSGSNTFTAKYRTTANTLTAGARWMTVQGLPV